MSASAVLLYHIRGLFFVDFPYIQNKSLLLSALYLLTSYGHQAVIIFFVLSGFFIGTGVIEQLSRKKWSWRTYLINRLTRLQLVLVPALLLGLVWDRIGMALPHSTVLYYGAIYKFSGPSVALRSTIPVFLGNLFFLQSILSPVFGSNGPLWSLSYEFWYYMLFPSVMLAMATWVRTRTRIFYTGFALCLLWFVGLQLSLYFFIWLAGTVVGCLRQTARVKPPLLPNALSLVTGLIFVVVLVWSRVHRLSSDYLADCLIAFCFGAWLHAMVLGSREDASLVYASTARKLAGFSYTLYLTHFPALLLLRALLDPKGNWQPDAVHLAYGFGITLSMMAYAYGVAEFTEARTVSVRRRLSKAWIPQASGTAL